MTGETIKSLFEIYAGNSYRNCWDYMVNYIPGVVF